MICQQFIFGLALLWCGIVSASDFDYIPKVGFVPDQRTAVAIAEAVLTPIYGAGPVKAQRPFKATLLGDTWTVIGYLPPTVLGGVATIEISRQDGRIIRVSHNK